MEVGRRMKYEGSGIGTYCDLSFVLFYRDEKLTLFLIGWRVQRQAVVQQIEKGNLSVVYRFGHDQQGSQDKPLEICA